MDFKSFFSFKKSLKRQGFFRNFTDYHCHVLPNVDDGITTMQKALDALQIYEELGTKEIWLTPHVMEDIPNTTEDLRKRFEELKAAYKGCIVLHLAAEYMMDNVFMERLENNDLLTIIDDKHILVETSFMIQQSGILHTLEIIKKKGYTPILAHPERYTYLDEEDFYRMSELGANFTELGL